MVFPSQIYKQHSFQFAASLETGIAGSNSLSGCLKLFLTLTISVPLCSFPGEIQKEYAGCFPGLSLCGRAAAGELVGCRHTWEREGPHQTHTFLPGMLLRVYD